MKMPRLVDAQSGSEWEKSGQKAEKNVMHMQEKKKPDHAATDSEGGNPVWSATCRRSPVVKSTRHRGEKLEIGVLGADLGLRYKSVRLCKPNDTPPKQSKERKGEKSYTEHVDGSLSTWSIAVCTMIIPG